MNKHQKIYKITESRIKTVGKNVNIISVKI